jgi:hypothetical protein
MQTWLKRFQFLLWLFAAAPGTLHAETEITLG